MDSSNNPITQSGTEPLSGVTGAGTVNQPYDQGNQYDGRAAQQESELIPSSRDTTLHPASASHGPHPTFAGNMLDPKTSDAAYQETFGEGAPDIDNSASGTTAAGQPLSGDILSDRLGPEYNAQTAGPGAILGDATTSSAGAYGTTGVTGGDLGTTGATRGSLGSTGATGSSYDTTGVTGSGMGTSGMTGGSYDTTATTAGSLGGTGMSGGTLGSTGMIGGGYDTAGVTGGSLGSTGGTEAISGTAGTTGGSYDTTGNTGGSYGSTGAMQSTLGSTGQSHGSTGQSYDTSGQRSSGYDAGDTLSSATGRQTGSTSVESRGSDTLAGGGSLEGNTVGGGAQGVNARGTVRPEHETDKTGVTSMHSNDPKFQDVRPSEANEARPNTNAGGFGVVESSVGADPSSAQKPEQKQQAADRPLDEPGSDQTEAINKKTQAAEGALSRDPDDRSGEPMKMHDPNQQERQGSIGQEGGGEHGKEKGTGEKWEKSTGLASEGGDFDATRPGAGREANRLLEEKGIRKDAGDAPPPASDFSEGGGMMDKLKSAIGLGK